MYCDKCYQLYTYGNIKLSLMCPTVSSSPHTATIRITCNVAYICVSIGVTFNFSETWSFHSDYLQQSFLRWSTVFIWNEVPTFQRLFLHPFTYRQGHWALNTFVWYTMNSCATHEINFWWRQRQYLKDWKFFLLWQPITQEDFTAVTVYVHV